MFNDKKNMLSHQVDRELAEISSSTNNLFVAETTPTKFIFRIDDILRDTSKAAYEPKIVSIGPYHRGKNKLEYLQGILQRRNENSAYRYINYLFEDEERARSCYAGRMTLSPIEFVYMMLLGGCFIIEFLRKYKKEKDSIDRDPIFKMESIFQIICRDLLLFENQIPFFILVKLFDMTKIGSNNPTVAAADDDDLISLAVSCLTDFITKSENQRQPQGALHLLGLMYKSWCYSFLQSIVDDDEETEGNPPEFSCINFGRKNRGEDDEKYLEYIKIIKSVMELKQYGIKFVKAKQSASWLDIKFQGGEIKIPPLIIHKCTESVLRNLIAYEQYMVNSGHSTKVITNYAKFMDCLNNTPVDVQHLRVNGIIKSWLGSNEEISKMFNSIGKNVFLSPLEFTYKKHFNNVNEHCNRRRNMWIYDLNMWISDLKMTYFKNPWSIISLVVAIFLLILTLIQTILSFLEHFKDDPKVVCSCK